MRLRRLALIALAAAAMSGAAPQIGRAQSGGGWKEYAYPEAGFAVQFPAPPKVEDSPYRTADGTTVPAHLYSLRQGSSRFAVTVADFSAKQADDSAAVDQAVKVLGRDGEIRVNIEARVNRNFGRQLSIAGKDGSRTLAAIFFVDKHLYVLTAASLPPNVDSGSADSIRFQQSLNFIGAAAGGFGGGGFGGGPGGGPGGGFRRGGFGGGPGGGPGPQAFASCAGKNAGDSVQLTTPGGDVAATCVLVARPNRPPTGFGPGGPPPDGGAPPPRN